MSSLGKIRRDTTGRIRVGGGSGWRAEYLGLRIQINGVGRSIAIHNEVAKAFLGPRPAGTHINHKDGNKHNNAAANLEYITAKQNHEHAAEMGLHAWGTRHGAHKLTEDQVRSIRSLWKTGLTDAKLGEWFGVSKSTILSIRRGQTWRHLP